MAQDAARGARLPRFFVPPDTFEGERVRLRGEAAHRLRHVLRVRPGERFVLLDNTGQEFETVLDTVSGDGCEGHVVAQRPSPNEPRVRLTLYAALLKHDKFEWVLQKGVELGVAAFQPVLTERCVAGEVRLPRLERWQRIVREAAEQSERGLIPPLAAPLGFAAAVTQAAQAGLALIPYEEEHGRSLRAVLREQEPARLVNLFIGPEGGFTPGEIELARSHGVLPVTLGPRILRAETASLAAAAVVLFEYGELG
jgi:16S rRNA (uracil1498-N3)-methyltransferase